MLRSSVDKFCYLGDMLSVNEDADAAVEARIRIGWNKFRQLVPLLAEKRMIRWMCGTKLKDRFPGRELRERLGIDDIALVLQQNRMHWYEHVLRKEDNDWVKKCIE